MSGFEFEELSLQGAYYIKNFCHKDGRGNFIKCFEKEIFTKAGINFNLNETFVSISAKNVIRGLHFQINNPQSKLVSVVQGKAWDVIVDLRPDSQTYKKWFGKNLCAEENNAFYVPKGFAHGFASLEDDTIMLYQCEGAYDKMSDTGIRYDDREVGIEWPLDLKDAIISQRDSNLMSFEEYQHMWSLL